jgi:P-type E1-E2 ATPase
MRSPDSSDETLEGSSAARDPPPRPESGCRVEGADILRIAGLGAVAALIGTGDWDAFGHPRLVGAVATLIGGFPLFRHAVRQGVARRITTELSITIALVAVLATEEGFVAPLITSLVLAAGALESLMLSRARGALCQDTAFRELIDALDRADQRRAPVHEIANRLGGYVGYAAMAAAAASVVLTHDVRATIAVMIVVGASGVVLGTPLAILGAIARAARSGAIIKGGAPLQALWSIDTVVLDEVGAVTAGDLRVRAVYTATDVTVREVLEAAAIAELRSTDPIGVAIGKHAAQQGISVQEPTRFSHAPGHGVRALVGAEEILVGDSVFVTSGRFYEPHTDQDRSPTVFVVRGGRYLGSIVLADMPRPDVTRAVADLRSLAIKTYFFTADSSTAAHRVGEDLFVDDFETGLDEKSKLARVQALARMRRVAAIGDGVTNAPSLAAATIGVAMGGCGDLSNAPADMVLIGDDLGTFVDALRLARHTHRIILQNVVGTLAVNAVGVVLGAAGDLTPIAAALLHVTSRAVFLLNSARVVPTGAIGPTAQQLERPRDVR